ncbi:MAG: IS110 family transposase [Alteromonadales bacterium]|nr:IS110 family transposase [Alteromonadales bacterium]MCP4989271.1 IS110 family transposase [Colwellia sp.]
MKCSVISIDLAKNIFQICALDENRQVLFNKKVKRSELLHELRQFEPTIVVMEACYSSNPWGRRIQKLGHQVRLIPPFVVKPFVIGNKNDANDALAIAEASLRPTVRFVAVKSHQQQDIQSLQRIVERMVKTRTGDVNQLRGLLSEYGVVVGLRIPTLMNAIPDIIEDANNELTATARSFVRRLQCNILMISKQIDDLKLQLNDLVKDKKEYQLLLTVPGVGPIIAAALMAAVGDANAFKNGRQLAAWIGLTPSQYASGETNRLGKISKRGNSTLRKYLIHGARTVLNWCDKKDDVLSNWLKKLKERMHGCKAVVALANKLARIIWSVLTTQKAFDVTKACA